MKKSTVLILGIALVVSCGGQVANVAPKEGANNEINAITKKYFEEFPFMYEDPKMVLIRGGVTRFPDPRLGSMPFFDVTMVQAKEVELGDFWVSETAIKVSQWIEFIKTSGYQHYVWPSDHISVDRDFNRNPEIIFVTWYEKILFCNWLSLRQGLQPVYEIEGEVNRSATNFPKVTWDTTKNGYRLATKEEWQWAIFQRMEDLASFQKQYEKDWFSYDETGITILSPNDLGIVFPKFGAPAECVWDTKNLNDPWNVWNESVYSPISRERFSVDGLRGPIAMSVHRDKKHGYSSLSIFYIPKSAFSTNMSLTIAGRVYERDNPTAPEFLLSASNWHSFRVVRSAK